MGRRDFDRGGLFFWACRAWPRMAGTG